MKQADMTAVAEHTLSEHLALAQRLDSAFWAQVAAVAARLRDCLRADGAILWCGNGGSAADAQHLAAELVGRFERVRRSLRSVALTTDSSALTAIANDFGYDAVFSRQVEGIARRGDALIGISTSGNSANVIRAVRSARERGVHTVGLLGRDGGQLADLCEQALIIPADNTARIQEMHILVGHVLCDLLERDAS